MNRIEVYIWDIGDMDLLCVSPESMKTLLPENSRFLKSGIPVAGAKFQSCAGEMLAVYGARDFLQKPDFTFKIAYRQKGKPYMPQHDNIHFNISHSGKYVACAVGNMELGIDIEHRRKVNLNIAKRYFAKTEYADLLKLPEQERSEYFLQLWTVKESYLKATGTGIADNLSKFTASKQGGVFVFKENESAMQYNVKLIDIDSQYFGAVTACGNFEVSLNYVSGDEVFRGIVNI